MEFLHQQPWLSGLIFAVGAVAVWFAGSRLAIYGDAIAEKSQLGQAFIGALLLGVATSLPEIATSVTASGIGNPAMAVNNLMGGVAMQVALLALIDVWLLKGALTFFSPRPVLLLAGVLLIIQLAVALMAFSTGELLQVGGVGLWPVVMFGVYVLSLYFLQQYGKNESWRAVDVPDEVWERKENVSSGDQGIGPETTLKKLSLLFAGHSLIVLAAGVAVSLSADALAKAFGLSGGFVGATVVALATSLPEVSTVAGAVRVGASAMAIANIFGTNMLEVALLLVADVGYRKGPIIDAAGNDAMLLAAAGILLTAIYLWGLLERKDKTIFGMGIDSALVVVVYCSTLGLLLFAF